MFVQTTWARREGLSSEDFNRLLSEHLSDVQSMRRIREAESRKLNEALERRKMKLNTRKTEDEDSDNSEEDTLSDTNSQASIAILLDALGDVDTHTAIITSCNFFTKTLYHSNEILTSLSWSC